jgi:hypothetical protein
MSKAMTRQTIAIPAGDIGEALTLRLREKPAPSEKVMVTVETVLDYTEISPEILESQRCGIQERMKSGDRASAEKVKAVFAKWS